MPCLLSSGAVRTASSFRMDDKHDYISWWLYESTEDKTVTWIENGVERSVDLTTPEALYDYIVESHLERERDERS